MTAYRAGQRVRIEWSDGTLLEGPLNERLMVGRTVFSPTITADDRTVTVLSEPRPDEPVGLGAVVGAGAWPHSDEKAREWSRVPGTRPRHWHDGTHLVPWDDLIDPVVLSEGWTPRPKCTCVHAANFHNEDCPVATP